MTETPQGQKVVWSPLPGSQTLAVTCPANIILFEGSRGPGKTDSQLMYFRKHVGQGYGKHWRGIIFDREYKSLDDIIAKAERWFPQFQDGARFLRSKSDLKWVWPTGEELLFRQMETDKEYTKYHGHEYPFIGWNELTKYPDGKCFYVMMSCNRSSFLPLEHSPDLHKPLPEIPLVVFPTTNPHGAGHNWVKRDFIDIAEPGEVVRTKTNVFDPRTQKNIVVTKTQVRIFGSYRENRFLSPEYVAELVNERNPHRRKAWLTGDWNIVSGGALDDLWEESCHKLPRFQIPPEWELDRSFDWGSTKPFSVCWWAQSNGEETDVNGTKIAFPKGSLFMVSEWYGTLMAKGSSNEGLKLGATAVANGIKMRENILVSQGWLDGVVYPGPADNSIRNVVEEESESIETKMADNGVLWAESDKRPGSRKVGLELVREMLKASRDFMLTGNAEAGPGIYFLSNCRFALALLPVLPRDPDDPDDVDTEAEDHIYDAVRYRVLKLKKRTVRKLKVHQPS